MTMHAMDCAALDERLADWLEGDLDSAGRREFDAHVASCVRCTALVRDLEQIRASAAELPELTPSIDLWSGIERRIETPVISLGERSAPNVAVRRRTLDGLNRAAVAAALAAVSAGVTYTLAAPPHGNSGTSSVAANRPPTPGSSSSPSGTDTAGSQTIAPDATPPTAPSNSGQTLVTNPASPGVDTYAREIDRLRTIFARNRAQLDPRTAAIIEANLKVIDDAIAQSKAALAQDPASRFLNNQLNSALGKKLELLQTAALLPNRT